MGVAGRGHMRLHFGEFTFDAERRELSRGSEEVHLRAKAFELLQMLVESRPRAVSQQDLYDRLWPKTYVKQSNLHNLVYQIREALNDRDHSIVRTVYQFGFAFAAPTADDLRADPTAWQLVIGDREYDLRDGESVVGRAVDAAVRIDSPSMSRRHARIMISGEHATIEDLGSKNGTTVDGRRIRRLQLGGGERILFGTIAAMFRRTRLVATETVP